MVKEFRSTVMQSPQLDGMDVRGNRREARVFFTAWRLCFLFVVALSIVAFIPALSGEKVWDDGPLLDGSGVGGNASFVDALAKPFLNAYFRPLVSLSFYIENQLWHGNPFLYHQTNILIHAATTALLMGLLLVAFGSRRIAILAGLLFAVQPAQVSTVAWIGGRTDSLCALLVTMFAYGLLMAVRRSGRARAVWVGASALSFFFALITKEPMLALLPLIPMAVRAFGAGDDWKERGAVWKLMAPYLLASFAFIVLWLVFYPNPFEPLLRSPLDQVQIAGHTSLYYSLLYFAPAFQWMHTLSLGTFERVGAASWLAGLALLVGFLYLTVRKNRAGASLGWFAALAMLSILPVCNLVPLPSLLVAPYRAGVAGLGVAAVLAVWAVRANWRLAAISAFAVWCAWLTFAGAAQWKDSATIFSTITRHDPYSIIARRNLTGVLLRKEDLASTQAAIASMEGILTMLYQSDSWKDPQAALHAFETDSELWRRVQENQGNLVEPEAWLGELFSQLGYARAKAQDFDGSRRAFESAIAISPMNPGVRVALSQYDIHDGKFLSAARHLRVAVAARSRDANVRLMSAEVNGLLGLFRLAEHDYRASIEIQPWFGPAYLGLADVLLKQGRRTEAIDALRESAQCATQDREGLAKRLKLLGISNLNWAQKYHP